MSKEHQTPQPLHDTLYTLLDTLCPMYLHVAETGHILHAGPTLRKLRPEDDLCQRRFLEVFKLDRPRSIATMAELLQRAQTKLHLEFRDKPMTGLKGVLMCLPGGQGAIVNLSFGISIIDGVRDYDLTSADFAATDLAIEMLYLVEAKSAAMDLSRKLNQRLQGAKIAAEEQAVTDMLTGLKNRRAADAIVEHLIDADETFSLMHLDLDFFKAVNDTLGHAAGDFVLQTVAKVMQDVVRDSDVVARVGGDEFVIIFKGLTAEERLMDIADRLIREIEVPIPFETHLCAVSASAGIVSRLVGCTQTLEELVQRSDQALYTSKNRGRGQASMAPSLDAAAGDAATSSQKAG